MSRLVPSMMNIGFPAGSVVENPPANAGGTGDMGLIPESGRFPGGGNGKPLQCSFLGNPVDILKIKILENR